MQNRCGAIDDTASRRRAVQSGGGIAETRGWHCGSMEELIDVDGIDLLVLIRVGEVALGVMEESLLRGMFGGESFHGELGHTSSSASSWQELDSP